MVGDIIAESVGEIIPEWVGDIPRNQQLKKCLRQSFSKG